MNNQDLFPAEVESNLGKELQRLSTVILESEIVKLQTNYLPLKINGLSDKEGYQKVFDALQIMKKHRLLIESTRKELKQDALEYGRSIDSKAKEIRALVDPIENHLLGERKAIDDEVEQIKFKKEYDSLVISVWDEAQEANEQFNDLLAETAQLEKQMAEQAAKEAELKEREEQIARKEREEQIRKEEQAKAEQSVAIAQEKAKRDARETAEQERVAHLIKEADEQREKDQAPDIEKVKEYVSALMAVGVPVLRDPALQDNFTAFQERFKKALINYIDTVLLKVFPVKENN